jgi:2-oxoglutarate ferredoxin oxidoreductase subunit gamma
MEHATIISGFGGQGILFAGKVLAQAALIEGRDVSWMPSYGPEMRGGTAACTVVVADHPIGSPIVDAADSVVALNAPAMAKYAPLLVPGGLLVVNESLVHVRRGHAESEVLALHCTDIARTAGDDRLVSVVALGGLLARRPFVRIASIHQALAELLGHAEASVLAADLAAFEGGYDRATLARTA